MKKKDSNDVRNVFFSVAMFVIVCYNGNVICLFLCDVLLSF